jgi:hypothetical protein
MLRALCTHSFVLKIGGGRGSEARAGNETHKVTPVQAAVWMGIARALVCITDQDKVCGGCVAHQSTTPDLHTALEKKNKDKRGGKRAWIRLRQVATREAGCPRTNESVRQNRRLTKGRCSERIP